MTKKVLKEIHLAATQGFCAGVSSAISVVELALEKYKAPIYVRHHIVHNTTVIQEFEKKGVIFIENLEEVPENQVVIFSAHGSAPLEYQKAKQRKLHVIDATCPLVSKIHREAIRFSERNIKIILIGHKGHQEMIGTSGYINPDLLYIVENESEIDNLPINENEAVGFLTQTTLSVSDTASLVKKIKEKFKNIMGTSKSDICFATQNRQNAVLELTRYCDMMIVCGSSESSNSNRLKELCQEQNLPSYMVDTVEDLNIAWLDNIEKLGITSGASVPEKIVQKVVDKIRQAYPNALVFQEENIEKSINFPIPTI
jgi:4-hydroxy-3-methylbut-2-enyl diphosphate reductase